MRGLDILYLVADVVGLTIDQTDSQSTLKKKQLWRRINACGTKILAEFGGKWPGQRRDGWLNLDALYTTGTVTATQNSRVVTGSGTTWQTGQPNFKNWKIQIGAEWFRIKSVQSDTSLTIEQQYTHTTQSGIAYQIWHDEYELPPDVFCIDYLINYIYPQQMGQDNMNRMRGNDPSPQSGIIPAVFADAGRRSIGDSYSAGTISGTAGSVTITGSGTSWLANVQPGYRLSVGGEYYTVRNIDSDTSIELYQEIRTTIPAATTYTLQGFDILIIRFKDPPDQAQTINYSYYAKWAQLGADDDCHWLFEKYPHLIASRVRRDTFVDKNDPQRAMLEDQEFVRALNAAEVAERGNAVAGSTAVGMTVPKDVRDVTY